MGFLSTLSQFLAPVAPVLTAIGGLAQIFMAFKARPPKIEIPTEIFSKIQSRVEKLTDISEEARKNIQSALEAYRRGELLPQYKTRLDEEFERKKQQAYSLLSARGLLNSSIAVDVMAELQRWYVKSYYDLLYGQLRDALSMAGLAEADIKALLTEAQAYSQALQAQAQAMSVGQLLNLGRVEALGRGMLSLSDALGQLGQLWTKPTLTQQPVGDMASKFQTMFGTTGLAEQLNRPYYPITGLEERLRIGD